MSEEEFEQYRSMPDYNLDYTLMMTGFPISGENFRTMIDAWKSGREDCGEFLEIGDFTMEVTNTGAVLSAPLKGEERDADLQFAFDEGGQMESITVNAHYSTLEILKKAGLLDVKGKKFTPHGLRHLFAVQNIKKCVEAGEDFANWMEYLCQYMGHKHIRYTLYYLHITSQLFPVYQDKLRQLEEGIGVKYAEE